MSVPVALSIAGSDSGGGAGIQADLKTFTAFGVFGATVVTALTAQNTIGVRAVEHVAPWLVLRQLEAVREDLEVGAAKIGMLGRVESIEAVAAHLSRDPLPRLVVDPVMVATSGDVLLETGAVDALRARLLPLALVATPNLHEAGLLLGARVVSIDDMRRAARALVDELGVRAALVTGGHLAGDRAIDVLWDGRAMLELSAPRIDAGRLHGTGCTLSAAIAAGLALGHDLDRAIGTAKRFVTHAIETSTAPGRGAGLLNHAAAAAMLRRAG